MIEIDSKWIEDQLRILKNFTDEGPGITRITYTKPWLKAHEYIKKLMIEEELEVKVDGVGNIIGSFKPKGKLSKRVSTGSHIDSVRNGGNYDGIVGVLSAIEIIRVIKRLKIEIDKQIDVIVFAAEEGERFNIGCLGSKAITGKLTEEQLNSIRDREGKTLLQAIQECGFSGKIDECRIAKGYYNNFIELHIEQGPILESKGKDIGVVTGISAPSRIKVTFKGMAGHSGTVPMDHRRDALIPLAETILEVRRIIEPVKDLAVGTVGFIQVKPNVATIIPEEATAIIEFRSLNKEVKDQLIETILTRIGEISTKNKVDYDAKVIVDEKPVYIPTYIIELIEKVANNLGYKTLRIPSGASHDAAHMMEICDVGMIFIPCKGGYSHMPKEETSIENIVKGVKTLVHTILSI
ncbi:MAG: M20 family metallo-hydrolase [Candidatus Methanomethylicia archaeon]